MLSLFMNELLSIDWSKFSAGFRKEEGTREIKGDLLRICKGINDGLGVFKIGINETEQF